MKLIGSFQISKSYNLCFSALNATVEHLRNNPRPIEVLERINQTAREVGYGIRIQNCDINNDSSKLQRKQFGYETKSSLPSFGYVFMGLAKWAKGFFP